MFRYCQALLAALLLIAGSAPAATITLSTGEVIKAKVTSQTDAAVNATHPVLGEISIPRASITAIVPDDADAPPAAVPAPAPQPEAPDPEPTGFLAGWESSFEAGAIARYGNSETLDFRLAFNTKKETDLDRWKFDASYFFASDDGEQTDNEFTAGLLKDWLVPDSPWFYWAQGRYDYDSFEDWTHRANAAGGLGYELVQEDDLTVILRAGAGASREFGSDDEDVKPEAVLGGEFDWKISEKQSLYGDTFIYPDLGDLGEFRALSHLAWKLSLDRARGLSFKLGLENEYESEVEGDTENNDLRVYGSLVFDF